VREENGQQVVWVLREGRAQRRTVRVSATNDDHMLLTFSIAAGEKVIVDSPRGLQDGAAVREKQP
jgi:hypothetical protein